MKHKVLIIVLSIIFVIFSSLSIIGYIEHNKDNKSNIDDDNKVVDNKGKLSCTFDGELKQGAEYVNGQYTYRYMQQGGYSLGYTNVWNDMPLDGWGVQLTDKESTKEVTSKLCTTINGKPIVSMAYMFHQSETTTLDLSSFDTSKVTNMRHMFYNLRVTTLDLSSFDTSKVTDMAYMFSLSKATIGYARTKADADKFNSSVEKPSSLIFVTKNEENNSNEDETNHDNNINDDDNEYIEEKELFIYFDKEYDKFLIYTYEIDGSEQEYIDSYKCINDSCKYSLDKNILAVYDDNKVLYKDLNKKEDFKESKIEKTYEYYDKYQDEYVNIKSYKILDNYYFVTNETNFFQEYDYDYTFDHATLEDGYVLTCDWRKDGLYIIIYDIYKEQMVASIIRDSSTGSDTFRKYNDFYIVHMYKGDIQDYIFTSNFELIDVRYPDVNAFSYTGDLNYYIKDDIIYYIDYNEEVSQLIVKDKDNNKIDYPNKNIQPLFIQDSYLLYLEEDNSIKIKDLSNDKIIVDSNLKFNQKNFWYFYIENNNFYIEYYDESVKKTKEWEIAKSKYDGSVDYEPGYLIEFNKNNKLIRKEISVLECYWCY